MLRGSQPKAHRHTGKRKCDTVPAQPLISTQEQVGRRANTVGRKQNVGAQTKGKRWIRRHVWRKVWNIIASKRFFNSSNNVNVLASETKTLTCRSFVQAHIKTQLWKSCFLIYKHSAKGPYTLFAFFLATECVRWPPKDKHAYKSEYKITSMNILDRPLASVRYFHC